MTPLALLVLLSGCAPTQKVVPIAVDRLCEGWRHTTIKKADRLTDHTASQIEGGNKARSEWGCEYGSNRAKGAANG